MLLPVVLQSGAIILQSLHGKPVFISHENVWETFLSRSMASPRRPGWKAGKSVWLLLKKCAEAATGKHHVGGLARDMEMQGVSSK